MTTAPINWQPMASMPEDRKDGRWLLLAIFDARYPEYLIGKWSGEAIFVGFTGETGWSPNKVKYRPGWETTETIQSEMRALEPEEPTHWADINPPA